MSTNPVGPIVVCLPPGAVPDLRPIPGRWIRLDPLHVERHAKSLFASIHGKDDGLWSYMAYGPFASEEVFTAWLRERQAARDPWFYAIVNRATGEALGMGAFMRADAANGSIEIGNIWLSPALPVLPVVLILFHNKYKFMNCPTLFLQTPLVVLVMQLRLLIKPPS